MGRREDRQESAHRTDKASVMPAEAQCLQESVTSIYLEVTASAFGSKHLLIIWEGGKEKRGRDEADPIMLESKHSNVEA